MTKKTISLALASAALVALALPATAQDKTGRNINPAAAAAPAGGARTINLAHDLYRVGVSQTDALTVLAAASLAASVATEEKSPAPLALTAEEVATLAADRKPPPGMARALSGDATVSLASSGAGLTDDNEGAANAPVTVDAMFAKASELAADDPAILGLINAALADAAAGRIGTVNWLSHLSADQTDVWEVPFLGNAHAELTVLGDGDTNLDIAITDENGNLICRDVGWSDALHCDFTPAWDGYFYVTVQNMGPVQNSYYLLTN